MESIAVAAGEAAFSLCGLMPTEMEREVVERLHSLLALPADALLQRLLDGPDGEPQWWASYPSLVTYLS